MIRKVFLLAFTFFIVSQDFVEAEIAGKCMPPDSVAPQPTLADFTHAAVVARPTVVHIKTYSNATAQDLNPLEEFFRDFYGDRSDKQNKSNESNKEAKPELSGAGSGVIISSDGLIITNNHIAESADRIEVVFNDKRSFNAKLIGGDPATDIALIKVEATGLTPIAYGNSEEMQIGDWVLAVGNPFNLTSTVTAGIVSAKGRNINILGGENNKMAIESFIQTDAAVNPGNSGGALVNLQGKLIGINTAIASPTGAFAGYSFAVPANIVKKVITDIMQYGQVQRGVLGVMIRDLNAELAKEKDIESLAGVYIENVTQSSAGDQAGLKKGDIIIEIEGIAVNNPSELQEVVAIHKPGDAIKIKYKRGSKEKETEAILKNKAGSTEIQKFDPESMENKLGAQFYDLSKDELRILKISGGVRVAELKTGKFKTAGMKDGFVITHIDKSKVASIKEAQHKLDKVKGSNALIEGIYPTGQKAFYSIDF